MKDNDYKVLIVDDIEENLQVVGNILVESKINILLTKNGKQAIKIAIKKQPDLILLDINMPEMNGYETCKFLKADENTKDIPVIFLSALSETDDIVKGFDAGGIDYITKPFNQPELLSRVFTHLYNKKSRDIINEQNATLISKNKIIEEQHDSIVSSINYAKLIQEAILPSKEFFNQFLPDNFVLYLPKDVVGGDFYWTTQIHNKIVIAVADCTGHGVPGAFMSMLGIAYLSEIFNRINNLDITADHILNQLRKRIKRIFGQDRRQDNLANGMDMALCIIDIETKKMDYAGAYRPLYIIRYNEQNKQNELIKYKADKMPIAAHVRENPFTNIEIQLKADDIIYLFSDGYVDQFGGVKDKKFSSAQFVRLLLDISSEPMTKQKDILYQRFYQWKGDERQVDDVLLIGIKISDVYGEVDFFNDF